MYCRQGGQNFTKIKKRQVISMVCPSFTHVLEGGYLYIFIVAYYLSIFILLHIMHLNSFKCKTTCKIFIVIVVSPFWFVIVCIANVFNEGIYSIRGLFKCQKKEQGSLTCELLYDPKHFRLQQSRTEFNFIHIRYVL